LKLKIGTLVNPALGNVHINLTITIAFCFWFNGPSGTGNRGTRPI